MLVRPGVDLGTWPADSSGGNERLNQQHDPIRQRLAAVVERGRDQGRFRTVRPTDWLVTTIFSLVHTAGR